MNYILLTPIKDEQENLSVLKETVLNQIVKPKVWVIIDGNSKDDSIQTADKLFKKYEWISIIKQKNFLERGYSHMNFAQAVNEGYHYAKNICKDKNINYYFIGKIDATVKLTKDYFKMLLLEMNDDPKLAITCGSHIYYYKRKKIINNIFEMPLTGFEDIRLYRKEFFEEIGGYPLFYSPDSILLIKAINRGWNVKISDKTYFIDTRLGGTKIGIWNGMKLKGKSMYVRGYHPILMFLNALYISLKFPPHYQALPMICTYLSNFIRQEEKIQDEEILEYYGKKRLKDIIHSLFNYYSTYEYK
ncbi:MAG: glycosyltransferase family A protein [Candidatus Bathyarchaeota archaeon]